LFSTNVNVASVNGMSGVSDEFIKVLFDTKF